MQASPIELLVIAPHPDDAEFGIAGTVAGLTAQGKKVVYVVVTSGEKGTDDMDTRPEILKDLREKEQLGAADLLGVSEVIFLRFPDGLLEDSYRYRLEIARQIRYFKPRAVASTDPYRRYVWHRDHRVTGQVVADAVYPFARNALAFPELVEERLGPHVVREMLFWGSENPNYHVNITDTFCLKLKALKCHRSQLRPDQIVEIENWLRQRAEKMAEGQNYELAEAFHRVEL